MISGWKLTLVAALVIVGRCLSAEQPADGKSSLQGLQGTWKLVAMERGGKKAPDELIQKLNQRLIIKGNKIALIRADKKHEATFKVDAAARPAAIDLTLDTSDKGMVVLHGVYQLDGDTLRWSVGRERPRALASAAGTKHRVDIYRRTTRP
jgi:uncharacterized protein (TIGR03067 family)